MVPEAPGGATGWANPFARGATPDRGPMPPGDEREVRSDRDVRARLVRSPLVMSFLDQARPGDVFDADPVRRRAAWANWCIDAMVEVSNGERTYPAITLPGSFYDPNNQSPRIVPHLEVPRRRLGRADHEFPSRLAQMGNGLCFPYWMYSEVTAVRRALLNTEPGPVEALTSFLDGRRSDLVTGLELANRAAQQRWSVVSGLILSSPDGLSGDATGEFSTEEVAGYLPAARSLGLRVVYDAQLAERNGSWSSRRVGVWQVHGTTDGTPFSLGVVTPRLTVNSLFNDELFAPAKEATAALLVRALLLRRLTRVHLSTSNSFTVGDPRRPGPGAHLRGVPARPGQKLPEASVAAAVHFLEHHSEPSSAWEALEQWADKGYVLTVTVDGFTAAHRRAARAVRRMEEPDRADIDCLLPLAWDTREGRSQVVRVTFQGE